MSVAVVFHDNFWVIGSLVVVYDDKFCSQFLSVQYFLSELANSSLYQNKRLDIRIILLFAFNTTKFRVVLFGQKKLADRSLAIRNVSKIRQGIIDCIGNNFLSAFGYVYFHICVGHGEHTQSNYEVEFKHYACKVFESIIYLCY